MEFCAEFDGEGGEMCVAGEVAAGGWSSQERIMAKAWGVFSGVRKIPGRVVSRRKASVSGPESDDSSQVFALVWKGEFTLTA